MLSKRAFGLLCKIRELGALAACLLATNCPSHAETLKESLTAAYLYNPTLKSARAQLRSTDNGVSLAFSGYRPTITATFQDGFQDLRSRISRATPRFLGVCPVPVAFDGTCPSGNAASLPLNSLAATGNGTSNPRSAQI